MKADDVPWGTSVGCTVILQWAAGVDIYYPGTGALSGVAGDRINCGGQETAEYAGGEFFFLFIKVLYD